MVGIAHCNTPTTVTSKIKGVLEARSRTVGKSLCMHGVQNLEDANRQSGHVSESKHYPRITPSRDRLQEVASFTQLHIKICFSAKTPKTLGVTYVVDLLHHGHMCGIGGRQSVLDPFPNMFQTPDNMLFLVEHAVRFR